MSLGPVLWGSHRWCVCVACSAAPRHGGVYEGEDESSLCATLLLPTLQATMLAPELALWVDCAAGVVGCRSPEHTGRDDAPNPLHLRPPLLGLASLWRSTHSLELGSSSASWEGPFAVLGVRKRQPRTAVLVEELLFPWEQRRWTWVCGQEVGLGGEASVQRASVRPGGGGSLPGDGWPEEDTCSWALRSPWQLTGL